MDRGAVRRDGVVVVLVVVDSSSSSAIVVEPRRRFDFAARKSLSVEKLDRRTRDIFHE
jgi:hypothetical protein